MNQFFAALARQARMRGFKLELTCTDENRDPCDRHEAADIGISLDRRGIEHYEVVSVEEHLFFWEQSPEENARLYLQQVEDAIAETATIEIFGDQGSARN